MKQGKIELKNMTYEHEDAQGCGPCCARCGELDVASARCVCQCGIDIWLRVVAEDGACRCYQVIVGEIDNPPDEEYASLEEAKDSAYFDGLKELGEFLASKINA